jgi:RND family efflux transporter MFP subunit
MLMRCLVLLSLILAAGCSRQKATVAAKQESGPVPVQVAAVRAREIQRMVESVGTLYPFEEAIISAEIDGKVLEVKFDLGDVVEQGQVLVNISDEEQRYQVAQSEAQLRQSMERLGLKNEKDRIQDINDTPEARKAKADLFEAEQRFKRTRDLADQRIGSKSDLDAAQARYQAAQATFDMTLYSTRNLIQEIERFKAMLDLQRKKLRDATVRAPFRGAVKERQVSTGQFVRPNTPLFVLVKTDPVRLRIEVPERMSPWIRVNQIVTVSLEAYEGRTFEGKIWRISPTVDQAKRTFVAEALIANGTGMLKPGSYARARVPTDKMERVMLVPQVAVNYVLGSNKAYVVNNKSLIEAREVKLGERFDQDVEILEGVAEGEQVATTQLQRIDTGSRVQIVKPGV